MKALTLPRLYQITPEPAGAPDFSAFLQQLQATLRSGVTLVQLRAKQLDRQEHLQLARQALAICRAHGATLIFNGDIDMALEGGCDGVHLTSEALMSMERRPLREDLLMSAACHNAAQLLQASRIGVDFVTLSPVLPTQTHPEAVPLGWQRFAALAAAARVPVFALGGMTPDMQEQAQEAGAWGIAAISATWCKPPPA